MLALKRILVPTDFSETSDAALKYGFGLVQTFNAQLYLLHVPGKTARTSKPTFRWANLRRWRGSDSN